MARTKNAEVPQVGEEAPEFNLPSAQGGNLRLSMRTVRGPVIVAFYRGAWSEDDVSYFKDLAAKEDEINLALGSIVGIAVSEVSDSRDFLDQTGLKSYVLYDYARRATPAWGLLSSDKEHGDFANPATFLVDTEHNVVAVWTDERPSPDELLAKVSEMTGLPKPPPEEGEEPADGEEKPKKRPARAAGKEAEDASSDGQEPAARKPSPEEREKRRAERKAAREENAEAKPEADAEAKSGEQPEAKPEAEAGKEEPSESSEGASGKEAKPDSKPPATTKTPEPSRPSETPEASETSETSGSGEEDSSGGTASEKSKDGREEG